MKHFIARKMNKWQLHATKRIDFRNKTFNTLKKIAGNDIYSMTSFYGTKNVLKIKYWLVINLCMYEKSRICSGKSIDISTKCKIMVVPVGVWNKEGSHR